MRKQRTLSDAYRFPNFVPPPRSGVFGDSHARILRLERRGKKTVCGVCGTPHRTFYDQKRRLVRDLSCGDTRVYLEVAVRRALCRMCQKVKREALPFLADNPLTRNDLPSMWDDGVALPVSKPLPASCGWIGTPSKPWTSSTCRSNCGALARRGLGSSGSMRYRSARGIPTESW